MNLVFHYKNLAKHKVSPDEVEQAFADTDGWSEKSKGGTYLYLGKTFHGRLLEIAYRKLLDGSVFVFHAMNAREHQRKRYKKRN